MKDATKWECDNCGKSGFVQYEPRTDVYTVVNLIERSHAEKSPACAFEVTKVKVSRIDPQSPN